jgi:hypothetical protein
MIVFFFYEVPFGDFYQESRKLTKYGKERKVCNYFLQPYKCKNVVDNIEQTIFFISSRRSCHLEWEGKFEKSGGILTDRMSPKFRHLTAEFKPKMLAGLLLLSVQIY